MKSGLLIFLLTTALIISFGVIYYGVHSVVPDARAAGYDEAQASFDLERQRLRHGIALSLKDSSVDSMALLASQRESNNCHHTLAKQKKLTREAVAAKTIWRAVAERRTFSLDSIYGLLLDARTETELIQNDLDHTSTMLDNERLRTDSLHGSLTDTIKVLTRERQLRNVAEGYAHDIRKKSLLRTAKLAQSSLTDAPFKGSTESFSKFDAPPNIHPTDNPSSTRAVTPPAVVKKNSWLIPWLILLVILLASVLIFRYHLMKTAAKNKRTQLRNFQRKLTPDAVKNDENPAPPIKLPRQLFFDAPEKE